MDVAIKTIPDRGRFARSLIALTLVFLSTWLLNRYLFPVYDTYLLPLRDISEIFSGCVFVVIALLASRSSLAFTSKRFFFAVALAIGVGWALVAIGVATSTTWTVVTGALVMAFGNGLIYIMVCTSFLDMDHREAGVVIACAMVISMLLRYVVQPLPAAVNSQLYFVAHAAIFLVLLKDANAGLTSIAQAGSVRDAQLIRPASFLPYGSQIFICMFVFRFVFGVALTYDEVNRIPIGTTFDFIPVLLVALYIVVLWRRGRNGDPDLIFRISFLFVLAGFLAIPIGSDAPAGMANMLLYSGSALFDVVSFYVIIAIGVRNRLGAISVFAWGTAMKAFGVVFGANLGRLLNSGGAGHWTGMLVLLVVMAFACYMVYFISHQRFAEVIAGVVPVMEVVSSDDEIPAFDEHVALIAQRYGLTMREREVLALLARGRNGHYIQEKLTVSYNTVKTHVFHIYGKLGVHTQQEIIDLVEDVEPR